MKISHILFTNCLLFRHKNDNILKYFNHAIYYLFEDELKRDIEVRMDRTRYTHHVKPVIQLYISWLLSGCEPIGLKYSYQPSDS